jgi:multiple sugar transport system substrate-binding protein
MRTTMTFLCVLFLVTGLTAWAGGAKETQKVTVPDNIQWVTADRIGNPNASTTITFAVDPTYSHLTTTVSRKTYLTQRMEEWAKQNLDVKLVPQLLASNPNERLAKQLEQAATGSQADAAQIDGQFVPNFYRWLQPVDQYFTKDDVDDWFSWCKKEAMIDPADGKLKAVWFITNTVGLWYNKEAIPTPPKSWDETINTGKDLKSKGWQYGLLTWGGKDAQITYGSVFPMFFGLGGNLVDKDGKPIYGEGDNRAKLIEVFSFWDRAVKEGVVPQRVLDINNNGDLAAEASKGKNVAMFLGGSWLYSVLKDNLKDDLAKWDFAGTPQKSGDVRMQIPGGYCMTFFAKDPKKLELAVSFMKYIFLGKDGMAGWCSAAGYTPVRYGVLKDFPYFSQDRFQKAFGQVIGAGARTRPNTPSYPVIDVHVQEAWQNVILQQQSPADAVDTAFKKTLNQLK